MSHLHAALPNGLRAGQAETSSDLLPALRAAIRPGDVVLIKGSFGVKMRSLVDGLKHAAEAAPATAPRVAWVNG